MNTIIRLFFVLVFGGFVAAGVCRGNDDSRQVADGLDKINHTLAEQNAWWKPFVPILGGAASAMLGFLISQFVTWFMAWWKRPLLIPEIEQKQSRRCFYKLPFGEATERMWLRLLVRNLGKDTARKCRAFLVGIKKLNGKEWNDTEYHDVVQLSWAFSNQTETNELDITKGVDYFLDICEGDFRGEKRTIFPKFIKAIKADVRQYDKVLEPPGTYRLLVQLVAENCKPLNVQIRLTWHQSSDPGFEIDNQ